jgi:hypothetical protein
MSLSFDSPPVTISDIGTPGFYQSGLTKFTLSTNGLVASANKNSVEINGSYPASNTESKNGEVVQKYNIGYYYDGIPIKPILTGITISVNDSSPSTTFTYLCGIKVYYGQTIALSVTTSGVSNIGKFFYNPKLIVYSVNGVSGDVTTNSIETDLTNVTTAINSTTGIPNDLNFTNNNVILNFKSSSNYMYDLTLTATIHNIKNDSFTSVPSNKCMIYDQSSQTPQTLSKEPAILTSKNTDVIGIRIWSGSTPNDNLNTITALTNYAKTPSNPFYYQTPYDHTQLIHTGDYNNELLYSNYLYQTKGLVVSGLGYSNYTSYSNPNLDYSSIPDTGYRYLTLCWVLIPSTNLSSITSVAFKLNTCSENGGHSSNFTLDNDIVNSFNGQNINPITCFCRLESASTTVNNGNLTPLSSTNTPWISGNNKSSDTTYVTYSSNGAPYNSSNLYNGTGNNTITKFKNNQNGDEQVSVVTFNVNFGTTTLTENTYLYLRLGFRMGNTVAFKDVTARVS